MGKRYCKLLLLPYSSLGLYPPPVKPLIAISPQIVQQKGKKDVLGSYRTYFQAIEGHGGTPVVLGFGQKPTPKIFSSFGGLLLTGGDDLHPKFLGLEKDRGIPLTISPDERSAFEISLAKTAFQQRIPILGLCLGAQTMNVACRGSIFQDLPKEVPDARNHAKGKHEILVVRGTLLRRILGKNAIKVNSRHHQANRKPGKGLVASAFSSDGVCEAIEAKDHPFYLGLQWHPEETPKDEFSVKVFRAFIRASRG